MYLIVYYNLPSLNVIQTPWDANWSKMVLLQFYGVIPKYCWSYFKYWMFLGFKMLFKEKEIHAGCISPFPVLTSLTFDWYTLQVRFSKELKIRGRNLSVLLSLKSQLFPQFHWNSQHILQTFKVLASLSTTEFTTYLRIISYLLFYMMVSSTIANQTFIPQKDPLHVLKLGLKVLYFLDRIMAK